MTNRENAAHKLLRILGANGGYLGFYYTATASKKRTCVFFLALSSVEDHILKDTFMDRS